MLLLLLLLQPSIGRTEAATVFMIDHLPSPCFGLYKRNLFWPIKVTHTALLTQISSARSSCAPTAVIVSHASRQRIIPPRTRPKVQCIRILELGAKHTDRWDGWVRFRLQQYIWVTWVGLAVVVYFGTRYQPGAP